MIVYRTGDLRDKLAAFLYNMVFPKRNYETLPDSVKLSYLSDADKILDWFKERSAE